MFIYRLYIGNNTIYIGKTKNIKQRYGQHKFDCFNDNYRVYNNYKYLCIRQIGITKEIFMIMLKLKFFMKIYQKIILKVWNN